MNEFVVGIDIGGTNVKFGLIDKSGRVIKRSHLLTRICIRKKNDFLKKIIQEVRSIVSEYGLNFKKIKGFGIGLPGLVDPKRGIVKVLTNIPHWKNIQLKKIFEKEFGVPTFLDNDVNLIALGEWYFGAGVGVKDMVCLTLGTGVGGGLILNNHLYRGSGFMAGEIGHMPLNVIGPRCNCGGIACFERYVGNRYLMERIQKCFSRHNLGIEDVYQMAQNGNKRALKFWNEIGIVIGQGLTGVVNLLNPTHIVIGGGVSNNFKFLVKPIRATLNKRAMKIPGSMVKIVKAKLGDDAGLLGALVLVNESLSKRI